MASAYCGKCGQTFCSSYHRTRASNAIKDVDSGVNDFLKITDDITKLSELIPENFGKKDELGQNVELYLKEISKSISKDFCEKISNMVRADNEKIKQAADDKDQEAANWEKYNHSCPADEETTEE